MESFLVLLNLQDSSKQEFVFHLAKYPSIKYLHPDLLMSNILILMLSKYLLSFNAFLFNVCITWDGSEK